MASSASTMTPALPFADDPELAALLTASVQAHTAAAAATTTAQSSNPFAADEQHDHIALADPNDDEDGDEDEGDEFESAAARIAKERSSKDDWQQTAKANLTHSTAITTAQHAADQAFDHVAAGASTGDTALSQRARKKISRDTRAATAGDAWYGLPRLIPLSTSNTPSAKEENLTPAQRARALTAGHKNATVAADARSKTSAEIAREVQAIRLRNALDPKRFYRGAKGDRALALPEFAQIGTILPDEFAPSQNLGRAQRSRTKGSVVEELLRDDTAKEYATRKFSELQDARGSWSAGQKRKKDGGAKKSGGSSSKKQRK
ncbi:unnamed protein product [Tilletia controversa]|uniref:Fcf2 pre-rRNA processing C-terminal domain-containing protein n=4 Tax=Tilletia TaxID=13289 RepID=A0A8X7N0H1_9BASI|nr:hypothetical protein CF335_g3200 [Tilletia laevis]KAE8255611.1 hypothetical protein A4X06_0g331 [Tilletia controversa]KAE8261520.1 hypothetical protein A4X03_0g3188 [Tilletia caries]CAD6904309.1 unnamed protein product [Tilletia controversa]CAD6908553.1 unnamed protein product [Tilletia laevis]